jgi:hypothetical protein
MRGRKRVAPASQQSTIVVAAADVVDKHLLHGLVVSDRDVTDGASADEVTDFFGQIFGVIAGALERLRHEDDLQAGLADEIFWILDVTQEQEVPDAVHFGIGAEDVESLADIAAGKCGSAIGQHFLQQRRHLSEIAGIFGVNAPADRQGAVGEAEQQIADAFESDHNLHAGEQFACFGGTDLGDGGGDSAVDFHIERVELALALAQGVEQLAGAGCDALSRGASGFLCHATGFHGASHEVMMSRFGIGDSGRGTHG